MTYQTIMTDVIDHIQTEMLTEFSGKDGKLDKLIDVDKYKDNHKQIPDNQLSMI